MAETTERSPIFFLFTRSFWLTALGIAAMLVGDIGAVKAFAEIIALILGVSPLPIVLWVQKLAPAVLFVAALQQRMGPSRPYSMNPKDT